MRKAILILSVVLILVSLSIPAFAGSGNPNTERQGEQTGQAKQQGPGGPNYGKPISIISPVPPSVPAGMIYTVFVPFVSSGQSSVVREAVSQNVGTWK